MTRPIPALEGLKPKSWHSDLCERESGVCVDCVLPGKHMQLAAAEEGRGWSPEGDRWSVIAFSKLMSHLTAPLPRTALEPPPASLRRHPHHPAQG